MNKVELKAKLEALYKLDIGYSVQIGELVLRPLESDDYAISVMESGDICEEEVFESYREAIDKFVEKLERNR